MLKESEDSETDGNRSNLTKLKTKSNFDSTTAHDLQATRYFQKRCRVKFELTCE